MTEFLEMMAKKKFMEKINSWTRDDLSEHLYGAVRKIEDLKQREAHQRNELRMRNEEVAKLKKSVTRLNDEVSKRNCIIAKYEEKYGRLDS